MSCAMNRPPIDEGHKVTWRHGQVKKRNKDSKKKKGSINKNIVSEVKSKWNEMDSTLDTREKKHGDSEDKAIKTLQNKIDFK